MKKLLIVALLVFLVSPCAFAYTVGGAPSSLSSNSWAFDQPYMTPFRDALENPNFFGPGGIVEEEIVTTDLSVINATTLSGVDMFISSWIDDGTAATFASEIQTFFLGGGDLFLLQDDDDHDGLGTSLGISTTASDGSVSNGGFPFFDGPFGEANNVTQHYLTGQLDPDAITSLNGNIVGTNVSGQVTSAYWAAGEYAPGSGALFIIADVDMIATTTTCGEPVCGADYGENLSDLNDNAIYALNTFSFLIDGEEIPPTAPVPEPSTWLLLGTGLAGLAVYRRKRK